MATLAKDSPAKERDIIFAYTAGFIAHYALDVSAHPYVYAMTHNNNAPKIKNSASHRRFETAIDVAMLNLLSGQKPADYNQWELLAAEAAHMCAASSAASHVLRSVYGRNIPSKIVHRAMRHMMHLTRLLQSRKGRRKKWMELAENLTIREPLFSCMVHPQDIDEFDYLNTQKKPWHSPWEADAQAHNDSFAERYHAAIEEGAKMIRHMYSYVYEGAALEALATELGNRSLKTGMECAS